jgi:serine/threonine protein kinase
MGDPRELGRLKADDLKMPDLRFTDGTHTYVTSGREIGHGGMGAAYLVTRWQGDEPGEVVVAKTFREEFLLSLREDEVARRHFDHFERVADHLRTLEHPNVLPMLGLEPISDNYLLITPLAGASLWNLVAQESLSPRERVDLLCQALRGLAALHAHGLVHRDFTLQNVLTVGDRAVVFDFDISLVPELLADEQRSYRGWYRGRIVGAPEYSVAPELLDGVLSERALTPRIDVYAIGTALYALFSESSLYGAAPDLPTLFERIAAGVVRRRESRIPYAETVPAPLWPIIEACLERDPDERYADAGEVLGALELTIDQLSPERTPGPVHVSVGADVTQVTWSPEEIYESRADPSVTLDEIRALEPVLRRYGYLLEASLGRVKGHPIYLAMPDPVLVGSGQFPDENTYRKIVTIVDLSGRVDAEAFVTEWLTRIYPIVSRVRQGFLTALNKVVHDRESRQLLLFSEYVADARFGTDLTAHELSLEEVFGLGLICALSIARIHEQGLAHNNVDPQSLVFKGLREQGRVVPLFVGLVEPTFDAEARSADVRNLAKLVAGLIRQTRVDALRADLRRVVELERADLEKVASGASARPSINLLTYLFSRVLGAIDPNFEILRTHEGDVAAFADLLVRHSLYNKLYQLDLRD